VIEQALAMVDYGFGDSRKITHAHSHRVFNPERFENVDHEVGCGTHSAGGIRGCRRSCQRGILSCRLRLSGERGIRYQRCRSCCRSLQEAAAEDGALRAFLHGVCISSIGLPGLLRNGSLAQSRTTILESKLPGNLELPATEYISALWIARKSSGNSASKVDG
jgi:hypothetical protein